VRSLHSDFGFEPQNAILADTDLRIAGYSGDQIPLMQKRMHDAVEAIPGVESVGLVNSPPLYAGSSSAPVFTDKTVDLRPVNAVAEAISYSVSPDYFRAAGTALLSGRSFVLQDDKDAPRVAMVNAEFARKVFGSVTAAIGGSYKLKSGTRIQVVGIVESGKYEALTEDPKPAMFFPLLQSPSSETWMVVRSSRDSRQMAPAIRNTLRNLDTGLPVYIQTWTKELEHTMFGGRMAAYSLGVLGLIAAMLCLTGIFGTAAYSVSRRMRQLGIRMALGAQRKQILQAALGRAFRLLALGSGAGLVLGILASRVLASIVYEATPRDPLVLMGVVFAMSLLGLLASWIPAQRALAVDPLILLREE
jgi:predicted permease